MDGLVGCFDLITLRGQSASLANKTGIRGTADENSYGLFASTEAFSDWADLFSLSVSSVILAGSGLP